MGTYNDNYQFADLNADGYPDLYYNPGNSIFYYHLSDNDVFTSSNSYLTLSGSVNQFTSGDIDNDGDVDVLASNSDGVDVIKSSGGSSFSKTSTISINDDGDQLRLADLNGDNYLDLISSDNSTELGFEILLNNGDGSFGTATKYDFDSAYEVGKFDTGDMDGDGDLDIVFYLEHDNDQTGHYLIAANNGSGGFGSQVLADVPKAYPYGYRVEDKVDLNDMDGDGELDIVSLATRMNNLLVFFENSTLSSSTPSTQVSNLTLDTKTHTGASLSWTKGDGTGRLIVIKEASSVTQDPSDNGDYAADAEYALGDNIGDNTYVVYAGAFSSMNITGLSSETEYTVKAFEMNGLKGSESFLLTSAPSVTFSTSPPPTYWEMDADSLVFTKADNADFTQPSNYDKITPNVWLTRGLKKGLFNIATESAYDDDDHTSPKGTKWALGTISDGVENLTFDTFRNTLDSNIGDNIENADMVMYAEDDDLYVDIVFRSWTQGGGGSQGGFSYTRATGDAIAKPTITPDSEAGSSVVFNGSDAKLEIKSNPYFSPQGAGGSGGGGGEEGARGGHIDRIQDIGLTANLTFEMWVKPHDSSYVGGFMAYDDESSGGGEGEMRKVAGSSEPIVIGIDDGNFYASVYDDNSNSDSTVTGTTGVYNDQWYHVAVVFDYDYSTDQHTLTMYVDGVQDGSTRKLADFNTSRDALLLGTDNNSSGPFESPNYFDGEIDEFRVWRSARPADSIRHYMHRTINSYNKDLVGYWQFNEGTGTTATDEISSEEATLTNVTWATSAIPVGNGTTNSASSVTTGTNTVGNATISLSDDFDNAVDIYATEVNDDPNDFPSGYTAGVGSKYFVLEIFGSPGTFSADITLTFSAEDITSAMETDPSTLNLYKREGTSSGSWTSLGGASSANASTGEVTWTGITSFSQFMAVEGDPYDLIQLADDSDVVAYDDTAYTFSSTFFDLNDNYADSTLKISVSSTPGSSLFIDKNSNATYDAGTDSLLESGKEFDYTASGSEKLIYESTTQGIESLTVTLKSTDFTDSVPLDFLTVEGRPSISGTADEHNWYLLSNPFTTTIGEMVDTLWTQGAVNSDAPNGDANLYTFNQDNSTFEAVTTDLDTTKLKAGQGIAVYIFAFYDYSAGIPEGGGWPKTLTNFGTPHGTSIDLTMKNVDHDGTPGTSGDEGWVLFGNPFGWQISADSILATIKREDASANNNLYRWDAVNGQYEFFSTGAIEPYEAVFAKLETSGVTANITLDDEDKHQSGGSKVKMDSLFVMTLKHPGSGLQSESYLRFGNEEMSNAVIDPYDAYYRGSLAGSYANLYTQIRDQKLVMNNLPATLDREVTYPVHLDATESGEYTLQWDPKMLPKDWKFTLEEKITGTSINLSEEKQYSFTVDQKKKMSAMDSVLVRSDLILNDLEQDEEPLFVLTARPGTVTGTGEHLGIPVEVELNQNYPNPFNPSTIIRYGVPKQNAVQLEVFDIVGRRVMTLVNNEIKEPGRYDVSFNGSSLASGIYFYRLIVGQKVLTRKMMLIK